MPLLMIEPQGAPPDEQDFLVPGSNARAFRISVGQLLAVADVEGGQSAALFGIAHADPGEVLSPHHTRVFSNSFVLRLGMRLVTNRRRPAFVLSVSPADLRHDLLMPAATVPGAAEPQRQDVLAAFRRDGIEPTKIADPINLFLDVGVGADGSLTPRGVSSTAGATVVLRCVMDMTVVVVSAGGPSHWGPHPAGPIRVQVRNELTTIRGLKQRESS